MKRNWLTVLIICVALMFAWIFLAVTLTGGREVADFTQRDKQIMIGFTVAELLTVAVMMVSACMLGKQLGRSMPKTEPVSLTRAEKTRKRRGACLGSLRLPADGGRICGHCGGFAPSFPPVRCHRSV